MAIDWVATGSWMQAWGGFAQAGAVVYAGYKAANVFDLWRRQKIAERKLALAERILDIAYRVRRAFAYVRSGVMEEGALRKAETKLREQDGAWLDGLTKVVRKNTIYSQAIYDRIIAHAADWDELNAVMPSARAFFGSEVEDQLQLLWRQRGAVVAAAQSYATDQNQDADFSDQLRRAIWENYGSRREPGNEIDAAIGSASDRLERLLQPLLRETVDTAVK